MMRKVAGTLVSFLLCGALLTGCGTGASSSSAPQQPSESVSASQEESAPESSGEPAEPETQTEIRIAALKGPTAMGMVKLMEDAKDQALDGNHYTFTIVPAIDEVTPKLVQGEVDIAAVPANLAAVLYNNTDGQVQVLGINTLGVLYLVESGDTVQSAENLRGKTIYASGKGATPEYALNYILSQNGLDPEQDVTIEWKSEHSECVAALLSQENAIAMLPQPFVTTAQLKNEQIRIALDLTKEWDAVQKDAQHPSALLTGVVVGRKAFLQENPQAISAFLDHYKVSVDYVNGNLSEAAALIEEFDIVPAAVAQKAIPYCNITLLEGTEMKDKLSGYLAVLAEQNPKAVGGALPDDAFYYIR